MIQESGVQVQIGVTLAGVLVAVSIPIFTAQLEKSREATDLANLRAAKAEAVALLLDSDSGIKNNDVKYYDAAEGKLVDAESAATKVGKGTAATTGATYTDPSYAQFSYTGGDVAGKSIKCTFTVPTDGTESSVKVEFAS